MGGCGDESITVAEVTKVVTTLPDDRATGLWILWDYHGWHMSNVAWRTGTTPVKWQTGVEVHVLKKGDQRVCSNCRGVTPLRKVYSKVLDKRLHLILEPDSEKEAWLPSCHGKANQIFTPAELQRRS